MAKKKIWIDLDNSPHVPFFIPIIRELEKRGHSVFLTSRDCYQVSGLASYHNLNHKSIGRHFGKNKLMKLVGTMGRSLQLLPTVLREKPDISLSHGSRSLVILSYLLGIPSILLFDYEYAKWVPFIKMELGLTPETVRTSEFKNFFRRGIKNYSGLKEDVYIISFKPDPSILNELNINENNIVVTIRPPATEAHYHNQESEDIFIEVVNFIGEHPDTKMIILPRSEKTQREWVLNTWPEWCETGKINVPEHVVDGINLIWHSDLVISGGGTMNREAAALNVPVYSIFRGKIGGVDSYLSEKGRLTLIETTEDVRKKIQLVKRSENQECDFTDRLALKQIVKEILEVMGESNNPD